jgi:hemoglobin
MCNTDIQTDSLCDRIGGKGVIDKIVDSFYDKMLADYYVNRFFNDFDEDKQREALKNYLIVANSGATKTSDELNDLLNKYFLIAFARKKEKSFVNESDFGFFGMIIEQDHPSTKYLCDSHSYLLQFMPDDTHYDVVMKHLTSSLQELKMDNDLVNNILAFAESARDGVLGN